MFRLLVAVVGAMVGGWTPWWVGGWCRGTGSAKKLSRCSATAAALNTFYRLT